MDSVPFDGPVTTAAVSGLSTSVSLTSTPGAATVSTAPWSTEYVSFEATGASFTDETAMLTVADPL